MTGRGEGHGGVFYFVIARAVAQSSKFKGLKYSSFTWMLRLRAA